MLNEQRQTLSFLRDLFQHRRLRPKNKLGQNFLIDLNLIDLLVRHAEVDENDLVIEIGSGTGGLTAKLAALAGAVFSVEIDGDFFDLANEAVKQYDNVRIVRGDILKNKNHFNPDVLAELDRFREAHGELRLKMAANLPYAVATPVIANFLLSEYPLHSLTVTVQWEIAERLAAKPATKAFSALSVLVQSIADVEIVRRLAPTVFWPRPQVWSAIVDIRPNIKKRANVPDVQKLRDFLRDLYSHRRKNLRGALVGFPGKKHTKPMVDEQLAEMNIDGGLRAETLSVKQHLRLCEAFGGE